MASGLPSCFAFRCIASNWHRSTCQEWQERGENNFCIAQEKNCWWFIGQGWNVQEHNWRLHPRTSTTLWIHRLSGNVEARREAHGLLPEMKLNGDAKETLPTQEGGPIEICICHKFKQRTSWSVFASPLNLPLYESFSSFQTKNTPQIFYLAVAASEIILRIWSDKENYCQNCNSSGMEIQLSFGLQWW